MSEEENKPTPEDIINNLESETKKIRNLDEKEKRRGFVNDLKQMNDSIKPNLNNEEKKQLELLYTKFIAEAEDVFTGSEWDLIEPFILSTIDNAIYGKKPDS